MPPKASLFTFFKRIFMNNEGKIYTEGIKVKSRFAKWFDNYWYHYKWITLGAIFLVVVIIVTTVQSFEKDKEDVSLLYAGPSYLTATQTKAIQEVFNTVMPEDFDGNGEKYTGIVAYTVYSEEQIKDIEAQTDDLGVHLDINNQANTNSFKGYSEYILVGESAICFVDESLYLNLSSNDRLLPLSVALGADSGYEDNVYGLRLGKLDLYRDYSALRVLDEDTVVCILRKPVVGKISKDNNYENELRMFRAIVNYSNGSEADGNEK